MTINNEGGNAIYNEGGNAIYVEDGDDNDASPQTIFPLRPRIKLLIF